MTTLSNLILIGMPSCGKSTLGVLLAKHLAMQFIDTDLLIQKAIGMRLYEYQQSNGMASFRKIEADVLSALNVEHTVVGTGGSAVYYPEAMAHLKADGRVIFLDVPLLALQSRIGDLSLRGVVCEAGSNLTHLYEERLPLYRQYADVVIDCGNKPLSVLVAEVASLM